MALPETVSAGPIFSGRAAPTHGLLRCDHCRVALPEAVFNTPVPVACPSCDAALLARTFPAFHRSPPAVHAAETVGSDEDASCFYHPRKKAVVPCARCGRFLCALCDLELDGRHLCPGCVSAARQAPAARAGAGAGAILPPRERLLYDKIALLVAILPVFVWPCTLVTAPVAFFLAIRYWNDPGRGSLPRTRLRVILAALLALLQILGWAALFLFGWAGQAYFLHGKS